MDDTIAPVLPHPHMPLHDAFANPQADAYKSFTVNKLSRLKERLKSSAAIGHLDSMYIKDKEEIKEVEKEIARINEIDDLFEKALIFKTYGDLEKYLMPPEIEKYISILSVLRDARISGPKKGLEKMFDFLKELYHPKPSEH